MRCPLLPVLAIVAVAACGTGTPMSDGTTVVRRGDAQPLIQRTASATSRTRTRHATPTRLPATAPATLTVAADPARTAEAWFRAAHSVSYLDVAPGAWTTRTAPLVTDREAAVERAARAGGGGSTWRRIKARHCQTSLRQVDVSMPSDTPSGPHARVVYVSVVQALSCADGTVELTPLAAQLILLRRHGRWWVADVRH